MPTGSECRSTALRCVSTAPALRAPAMSICPAPTSTSASTSASGRNARASAPPICPMATSKRTRRTAHDPRDARQGAGAGGRAAVAQTDARQDRRRQVRRQCDDRRCTQGRVRRRHGVPAQLRYSSRRRARRRPADQRDAPSAWHRRGFQGRLPGHHAGGARCGPHGAVRPGRTRTGESDQRARPVRGRRHRRGRGAVHRGEAQRHGRRCGHRHRPGRRCRTRRRGGAAGSDWRGPHPGGFDDRSRHGRRRAQHQRRYRRCRAGGGARRGEAGHADRCRGRLHQLARPGLVGQRDRHRRIDAAAAEAGGRHGAQDRGVPARRIGGGAERTCHRRPRRTLRAGRIVHRRRDRHQGGRCMSTLLERWSGVMMNNYGTPPLALATGDGAVVTDVDGKSYIDLLGGIAVNILGHRHPAVIEAVTQQLNTLGHTSNLYATEPGIALAESLVGLLGAEARVFFCNSGTEANEVAFKITRLTGRTKLVAAQGAFHGRTMGSLALTGQPSKQAPFAPLPGFVTHVPYGDIDELAAAVDDTTAAVFLEPIMGEGGVVTPPAGYLVAARELTTRHGALLVLDEVQTGIGRTWYWFAHQAEGVRPDVVTLAKGLGGGLPIGACLAVGTTADLLTPGLHGSTFGGNPVCTAAALAVLKVLADDDLIGRADVLGKTLSAGIESLGHPLVDYVRGRGLLQGVVLTADAAKPVEAAARDAGFLVNDAAPDVIRLARPLVITEGQIDDFLKALPGVLDKGGQL